MVSEAVALRWALVTLLLLGIGLPINASLGNTSETFHEAKEFSKNSNFLIQRTPKFIKIITK